MVELITVMAAKVDGRVVLWEVDAAHPGGEAFLSGDGRSAQVALTPRVQAKLDTGDLIRVQTGEPKPADPPSVVLPIADYDTLSAAAIVKALASLTDEERAAVREYEAANEARSTVLKALQ